MTIITDLNFFDTVFIRTDPDQLARIVTGIDITPASNGNYSVIYFVSYNTSFSKHFREELATTPDQVKALK